MKRENFTGLFPYTKNKCSGFLLYIESEKACCLMVVKGSTFSLFIK